MIDNKIFESDSDIKTLLSVYDKTEIYKQFLGKIRYLIEKILFRYWEIQIGEARDYNYINLCKAKRAATEPGANKHFREIKFFCEKVNLFNHDLIDNESAKAIIHSYYHQLMDIRVFAKMDLSIAVLDYLEDFYPENDNTIENYYRSIADKIVELEKEPLLSNTQTRLYYVIKQKPFSVSGRYFYEVTLSQVISKNRFDRFIAYSKDKLSINHGLKINFFDINITANGQEAPIKIVNEVGVGIRACELNNLARLSGTYEGTVYGTVEYSNLLLFLHTNNLVLIDLIYLDDNSFKRLRNLGSSRSNSSHKIYKTLKTIRNIILFNKPGCNIFKFLLTYTKNDWIVNQLSYNEQPNEFFNFLPIKQKSRPFENMPYAFSICGHDIPKSFLFDVINPVDRKHEIMAALLEKSVNEDGVLYYPVEKLKTYFPNYIELADKFNSLLEYPNHKDNLTILFDNNYAYLKGYDNSSYLIIKTLLEMSKAGLPNYESYITTMLSKRGLVEDPNNEKDYILKTCFSKTRAFILSGPAGTGKTFFISRLCGLLDNADPLLLARTNPAVGNLRSRPNIKRDRVMTIDKYLRDYNNGIKRSTNLLIIDECSTVSNENIISVLNTIDVSKVLICLAGDEHQIESIDFGNWFSLALKMLPDYSKKTLKQNYRAFKENNDEENMLKKLWDSALESSNKRRIIEIIGENYYKPLSQFDFVSSGEDEVVLCLNYDGFYGINNINRIMQSKNKNENSVIIGDWRYSAGDPIIFETNRRFSQWIYNDTKGKIIDIKQNDDNYIFTLEICQEYDPMWSINKPFCFISVKPKGNDKTIVSFWVRKKIDYEAEEKEILNSTIPFRVAYSVSIHKAQGLEFSKVKIVIADNMKEMISPNIFYTAITRTTKDLEIYSSPETLSAICEKMLEEFRDNHDYNEFVHMHHDLLLK